VLAFDMTTANHEFRRFEFRGKNKTDYYDGDLAPLSHREVDMKIERSRAGDCSIYKLTSRTGLGFRRSWSHIRHDKTNVFVFWFVRRGRITVSHPGGRHVIEPGECAITRSAKAFYMECVTEECGLFDALHVVVPSHLVCALFDDSIEAGKPFSTLNGEASSAMRILSLLFEEDDRLDSDFAEQTIKGILAGLSRTVEKGSGPSRARCTIHDKRVADITQYISQNFANPDLNARMVAESCGISLRYLCHVLKKTSLSFSTLVWEKRMATAHQWLGDEKMQHYSISEIAYLTGFKSSAHFSRMFKMHFGVPPREHRQRLSVLAELAAA
jgi:AraC family transcriptional activator of tynA and feaB